MSYNDNLKTTLYEEIITRLGGTVDDLPDRLETTYLKRIIECLGGGSDSGDSNTVTFTIDGAEYTVEKGTTWREWCDTTLVEDEIEDYYEWIVDDIEVRNFVSWNVVVDENGSSVNPDDEIVAGAYMN